MRHFFCSLSSPGRGRMVQVRDGVSATHSLYLCFCEESDLLIAKLCHSPVRFSCHQGLFRFPEVEGGDFTSPYVTCHPKEALPLLATKPTAIYLSVYLPTRAEQCVIYSSKLIKSFSCLIGNEN